jgi:hypothetical protein
MFFYGDSGFGFLYFKVSTLFAINVKSVAKPTLIHNDHHAAICRNSAKKKGGGMTSSSLTK